MKKEKIKTVSLVASLVVNVILVYLLFQVQLPGDYSGPDNQEVSRISSPDSLLEAVDMANVGGPATATVVEQLYIISSGGKPQPRTEFLLALHPDSLRFEWFRKNILVVHYRDAEIISFNNNVYVKDKIGRERLVEVRLEAEQ